MMLVLSRKIGDRIVIADSIEIAVVQIHGNKVRLGVTAPRHVSVRRHEVHAKNQAGRPEQQGPSLSLQDTMFEVVPVSTAAAPAVDRAEPKLTPG